MKLEKIKKEDLNKHTGDNFVVGKYKHNDYLMPVTIEEDLDGLMVSDLISGDFYLADEVAFMEFWEIIK